MKKQQCLVVTNENFVEAAKTGGANFYIQVIIETNIHERNSVLNLQQVQDNSSLLHGIKNFDILRQKSNTSIT